jgi:hypothetical protein
VTEEQWLGNTTCSYSMLYFVYELLGDIATSRKLRLYRCAWGRCRPDRPIDPRCGDALEIGERFADRQASEKELMAAWEAVEHAARQVIDQGEDASVIFDYLACVRVAQQSLYSTGDDDPPEWHERNCALLRHIFGNPFSPYAAPASWPGAVVELAQAMYDGAGDRLVLADALEEAGHQELAQHFRAEEWHPKGCWVVDLVLGKG